MTTATLTESLYSFADVIPASGHEASVVRNSFIQAITHYTIPFSHQLRSLKFQDLAMTWKYDSRMQSSVTAISMNPAYQEIIGMGTTAIPLILADLKKEPNHWFWALKAITGIDPVKQTDRGDLEKMAQAWIDWGKENGYI